MAPIPSYHQEPQSGGVINDGRWYHLGKVIYDGRWYHPGITTSRNKNKLNPAPPQNSFYGPIDKGALLKVGDSFDVLSYLLTDQRNYLIRKKGDQHEQVGSEYLKSKKYIVVFGFYIPVMINDEIARLCYHIAQTFSELSSEGKCDFEVVLVLRMRQDFPNFQDPCVADAAFSHFISAFPRFLAVPYLDSESTSRDLFSFMGICGYETPSCLITDLEEGKVVHRSIWSFSRFGAFFYPFTPEKLIHLYTETKTFGDNLTLESVLGCQTGDVLNGIGSARKGETVLSLKKKVVGIYFYYDGQRMDKISDLYLECKSKNYEFEVVLVNAWCAGKVLNMSMVYGRNAVCLRWLQSPLSDKVSRRLWNFYECPGKDKLMIVGPNFSVPHGFEVYQDFGIDTYPFTEEAVSNNEAERLGGITFPKLLLDADITNLLDSNGNKIDVPSLAGTNVVLYFGCAAFEHLLDWENKLPKWYEEIKVYENTAGRRFEIIFVCIPSIHASEVQFRKYCSKQVWLAAPNDKDCFAALQKKLGGEHKLYYGLRLVAFGSDGHLITLSLEDILADHPRPETFFNQPRDRLRLVQEIGDILVSDPHDYWNLAPF